MNKKKTIFNLIMNIPIALAMPISAQLLTIGKLVPIGIVTNFIISFILSFTLGMTLPVDKWGANFAMKMGAKPGTLKFGLLVNALVTLIYVIANSLVLTFFNVVIVQKAPFGAFVGGFLATFIPLYIIGYIVSFLWNKPAEKITENIVKESI